ncbi:transposase zinc-binding domain-containing protein [Stigmatella aurantiaca]|uniref:Transposase-like protein n=1 Tax=Stigmatella aurantiaca (strain DW4/3-1) TaxID=378806 RepID=E3FGE5_STIAD|nr:Transposase-like protein [Stigmatella aurantiaca DW4/3-1]
MLAHGFARVRGESGKYAFLVAFSCKGQGVCPSCNAKRAHVTAVHLVEQVLPHVPYRQWTLSFPHRVRWVLLKDVGLLSDVLTLFLRAGARPAATEGTAAGPTGWATGGCACWRTEGPCPRKGPRTRCRHTRRTPCSAKVRPFLLPQAGAEPGQEEESPAFAATVEEPLEGAHTPFGLGRAAEKDVRPGCVGMLEEWRQAEGCWRP